MSTTVVQTKAANISGTSSGGPTWTSNTTSGNLIVVTVTTISNITLSSVTDSQGNTYTLSAAVTTPGNRRAYIAYAKNITGGTTPTVTATMSGSGTFTVAAIEASGLSTTAPEAATDSKTGTGTSITSSTAGLTDSRDDLVVTAGVTDTAGTFTVGSGYTAIGSAGRRFSQYQVFPSGISAHTGPWSTDTSTDWASRMAVYAPDAAGATRGTLIGTKLLDSILMHGGVA